MNDTFELCPHLIYVTEKVQSSCRFILSGVQEGVCFSHCLFVCVCLSSESQPNSHWLIETRCSPYCGNPHLYFNAIILAHWGTSERTLRFTEFIRGCGGRPRHVSYIFLVGCSTWKLNRNGGLFIPYCPMLQIEWKDWTCYLFDSRSSSGFFSHWSIAHAQCQLIANELNRVFF